MQAIQSQQRDYEGCPTIDVAYAVRQIAVTTVAAAEDLHNGITSSDNWPDGRIIRVQNVGANPAYVVFDSVSSGTAAATTNAVLIAAGAYRDFRLLDGSGAPTTAPYRKTVFPMQYLKHISTGGNTALNWYIVSGPI